MGQQALKSIEEQISLLLVDDEDAVLTVTRRRLERYGYAVVACSSGEEALALLDKRTFDVMLSDIHMSGITGLHLLRAVRDRDLDLPVVLVTGNPNVATAVAAVEYGAFQYLLKPVAKETLLATIERAANAVRLARAKREYAQELGSGVFPVSDRAGADAKLDRVLASLWMAFQPIVRADGQVFAYEALMRSADTALPHPGAVLEAAELANRLNDVGERVRAAVGTVVAASRENLTFFVNLHPRDLLDPTLYLPEGPLTPFAKRVVLEITERAALDELTEVRRRIAALREMGFRIALDDLGAGYAGLTSFITLEPEFVKLDMSLIRDIHRVDAKQEVVGTMVNLCHEMGKQIVAEGVEQKDERDALVHLECDFLQGYFYAKPGPPFPLVAPAAALTVA